jgi:hypothetical protein
MMRGLACADSTTQRIIETDLGLGLALTAHKRSLILRRIHKDAMKLVERVRASQPAGLPASVLARRRGTSRGAARRWHRGRGERGEVRMRAEGGA